MPPQKDLICLWFFAVVVLSENVFPETEIQCIFAYVAKSLNIKHDWLMVHMCKTLENIYTLNIFKYCILPQTEQVLIILFCHRKSFSPCYASSKATSNIHISLFIPPRPSMDYDQWLTTANRSKWFQCSGMCQNKTAERIKKKFSLATHCL